MPEPTSICLLGGGGFLGSHLAEALARRPGLAVEVVDTSLDKVERREGLRLTQASLCEPGLLAGVVRRSQVVVSLTALCNPSLYNTRPLDVIESNFSELVPLVRLCRQAGRRLIHFSTCEVYGRGEDRGERAMSEDDSPLVLGPVRSERWTYSCAKQLLERLIWAEGQHGGLAFTIIRPFNVIGSRMDYLPGIDGEGVPRVLASFIGALLRGEPLRLVDGGCQRRAFMHVRDLVEAMERVLDRPAACRGQILNLGHPGNDVTIRELGERLAALYQRRCGGPLPRLEEVSADELYGAGYDDVLRRVPDVGKARQLLEWEPRLGLDEVLADILDDYLRRYGARAASPTSAARAGG
jgi:UDP-apiose/xylose synthase